MKCERKKNLDTAALMAKEKRQRQMQLWDPAVAPARATRTGGAFGPGALVAYTAA